MPSSRSDAAAASATYFDAAAGLPLHPAATEAMLAATEEGWADPSRLTGPGRRSALLLNAAREAVADTLAVRPEEVSFVPSGSHALHLAVLGSVAGRARFGDRLVHSAVEHSAVFKAADWHSDHGGTVEVIGVDATGRVDVDLFVRAASGQTSAQTSAQTSEQISGRPAAAAVLQAANHEVGTRQPVAEVADLLADTGVPLVVDAGHALLYDDPTSLAQVPVFTADARLWGGPAGVGVLVVRGGARWRSPFPADEAEFGRSPGVPSVPAIVGAAAALRAFRVRRVAEAARLAALVNQIRERVPTAVPDSVVLGDPANRLPHLVTFSCLYVDGEALLTALDRHDFAVSSGSSCTSDTLTPSHVLVAMGALSSGNVRVSLHPRVTDAAVERFLTVLPGVIDEVRGQIPGGRPEAFRPGVELAAATTEGPSVQGTVIDSRGRRCPLPVLDLARAIGGVPVGTQITVLADDPAAASDIAAWCRMRQQELVSSSELGDGARAYRVRRLR